MRHLLGLGHRRIAMVAGPDHVVCCRARLAGYEAARALLTRPRPPAAARGGPRRSPAGDDA
ncbi:hypothetical protein [Streptomyces hainanensis]|uniref:LacI family transcriptional regulator n=1 Tax=Streptomyces hainanensis TaxID=402648 RepID=A0A4R4TAV5_9ACTN|nr:hypothetical protein [Streptomyces hainanensis]TDC74307.1 hypothetical protein E1283_16210 [Streptomyces hainanensis]